MRVVASIKGERESSFKNNLKVVKCDWNGEEEKIIIFSIQIGETTAINEILFLHLRFNHASP